MIIATAPDGTRRYSNSGTRYRPVPLEERKYAVRKPDDPRAVRFRNDWYLPLEVVSDPERTMPETRPDEEVYRHMEELGVLHSCEVCRRPEAERYRRRWRRDHGLQP